MITRRNFFPTVCVVYTIMVLCKVLLELTKGSNDTNYGINLIVMFLVACFATFVLSLHQFLESIPLLFVIILQYLVVIGCTMLGIYVGGSFLELAATAYKDMFISVTVPYVVGAAIYYVMYFREVKRANQNLVKLNLHVNRS